MAIAVAMPVATAAPLGPRAPDAWDPVAAAWSIHAAGDTGDVRPILAAVHGAHEAYVGVTARRPVVPGPSTLEEGLAALAARHGVAPTSALDADARAALGRLDPGVRQALGGVVGSFLAMHDAALRADPAATRGARVEVVDAALALADAWAAAPPPRIAPPTLDFCPLWALDFSGPTLYPNDCILIIDLVGADLYHNNAGGNNIGGACATPPGAPAALVIDIDAADEYGDPASLRSCGANGGGYYGVGMIVDFQGSDVYRANSDAVNGGGDHGQGSIYDLAGQDRYEAIAIGINGGAVFNGAGFLLDLGGGNDAYLGEHHGVNGGAYTQSRGWLVDVGGDDNYQATDIGTNGGAFNAAKGLLIDIAGNDLYNAGALGTNGGAAGLAWGTLVTLNGDDVYTALDQGANGAANLGLGLLWDINGNDLYSDTEPTCNGSGPDNSVPVKCTVGAQLDT